MRTSRSRRCWFPIAALAVFVCGALAAGERSDIVFANGLDEEIVEIRVKYSTPYGEPRFSSSRVNLPGGGEYRIGVQGAIAPEIVILDLATKSYMFEDLSGLKPDGDMSLSVVHENGTPLLRRVDAEGAAKGVEHDYLTVANRPNAVDKDYLLEAKSAFDVANLVMEKIDEEGENQGELEYADVEAGPIWNQAHALERCPEVAAEWGEKTGREARWTGQWATTVPGEMSVCGCVAGTAGEAGTVFIEDAGWGKRAFFPVYWQDWFGAGRLMFVDEAEERIAVALRFRLPGDDTVKMLDALLEDLRIDGFTPVNFALRAAKADADGEVESDELEVDFHREGIDKWDAHDRVMEALAAAYAADALEGTLFWAESGTVEKTGEGEEVPRDSGVFCFFSKGTFEAVLLPDDSDEDGAGEGGETGEGDETGEGGVTVDDAGLERDATPVWSLPLRGNPSTGYKWSWTADGDGVVRETGVEYSQDYEGPGTPATFTYAFVGEKEGDVVLRFVYSRTETERPDDRIHVYRLRVLPDKRIALMEMHKDVSGTPKAQ